LSCLRWPSRKLPAAAWHPAIWAGIVLFALATMAWVLVLSKVDLSKAHPMAGATHVAVVLTGWLLPGRSGSPMPRAVVCGRRTAPWAAR